MTPSRGFSTRPLSREECQTVLDGLHLGRLAYRDGTRIQVRPVAYAHEGGWIFGRTSEGAKVTALLHNPWVTFQVDRIRTPWDWESVSVQGALHLLDPGPGEAGRLHTRAHAALAAAFPGFAGDADPGAFRRLLFGIEVQELEGIRGLLPAGGKGDTHGDAHSDDHVDTHGDIHGDTPPDVDRSGEGDRNLNGHEGG